MVTGPTVPGPRSNRDCPDWTELAPDPEPVMMIPNL